MSDVLKGVVKWFNNAKGFGFIEHTSGKDVFVHYSVIQSDGYRSLKDGEEVEYEIKEGPKGFSATRVARVNAPVTSSDSSSSSDSNEDSDSSSSSKGSLASNVERIQL